MPKTKISEYDSTASNNTDIDGVNISESCPPSGINNALREIMAHLKDFQSGTSADNLTNAGTVTSSGTLAVTGNLTLDGESGTSGQVLQSAGSGATPTWADGFTLADGDVTTAKIASDAVTGAKIADDAIDNEHIATDAVNADSIASGAVGTSELASDSVTTAKIASGAVDTTEIANSAVTNAKVASGISSSKLTGALPALDGSALTGIVPNTAHNAVGTYRMVQDSQSGSSAPTNPTIGTVGNTVTNPSGLTGTYRIMDLVNVDTTGGGPIYTYKGVVLLVRVS